MTARLYAVAAEVRRLRPTDFQLTEPSKPSEWLQPEVLVELYEMFSAGDTPLVAANKLGISYRAARRAKKKKDRRAGLVWCNVCRTWIRPPCVACAARGQRDRA